MLARTADNLFWLARSMERADFTARTIGATLRLPRLSPSRAQDMVEWESAMSSVGALDSFHETHDELTEPNAVEYLTFDRTNPSSICNCLENARATGPAVRTALTAETWTAINDPWLALKRFESRRRGAKEFDRESLARC